MTMEMDKRKNFKGEVRIPNKFNVKEVEWNSDLIEVHCPLGDDWCSNHYKVQAVVDLYVFDYDKLSEFIYENIEHKDVSLEEGAWILYHFLLEEIHPLSLNVYGYARNNIAVVRI